MNKQTQTETDNVIQYYIHIKVVPFIGDEKENNKQTKQREREREGERETSNRQTSKLAWK